MASPHTLHVSTTIDAYRHDWKLNVSNCCYNCGRSFSEVKQFSLDCVPCFTDTSLRNHLRHSAKSRGVEDWLWMYMKGDAPLG